MSNKRIFCNCARCGNIISYVKSSGVDVVCCGEKMTQMIANTSDGAKEKHVPVVVREGNKLTVTVGSVSHPMSDEHFIEWIVVADGNRTQRVALSPKDSPVAEFFVSNDTVTVYAYCNLHGLWEA